MKLDKPEELGFNTQRLKRINAFMERYVEGGKVSGFVTLVAREGRIVYFDKCGYQDLASDTPMELDTIFRIYSMTKPITSLAFMMLVESGLVGLEDPLSRFIPQFKSVKVHGDDGQLMDLAREMTMYDLLIHTSGLSYGGFDDTGVPVDKLYDKSNLFDVNAPLEELVARLAELPLAYQPGTVWHYSLSTDVIGRIIEIVAAMPLSEFLGENIFSAIGMEDTAFMVEPGKMDRLATLYGKTESSHLDEIEDVIAQQYGGGNHLKPRLYSGGAGLYSTAYDYFRFAQLLLNGGELEGRRLLGSKTIEFMTSNHVPPKLLPISTGDPWHGFGLGVSVMLDVGLSGMMGSVGLHGWSGWASTDYWVDPKEQLVAILMLQYIPNGTYPIRNEFRTAVYQAMIESA